MNEFPWLKSYPAGVKWDADLATMPVQRILEESAQRWPEHPAIDFMSRRISYRELNELADRAATGLQTLGVRPGVHVGLFLPNTPHYMIAFFGILKAGGTVVNYSPLDAARVLEHKIEDSETEVMITLDLKALLPQMASLLGKSRLKKLVVGSVAEMTPAGSGIQEQLVKAGELASVPEDDRIIAFEELLTNSGPCLEHPIPDLTEAICVLQYTGGTTGLPKGAMLTHANLSTATSQCMATTQTEPPMLKEGCERILAVLPPFHIYALTVNMLLGIRIGAELVLHIRFDVATVIKDIVEKRITSFPGVPTMYVAVINYPGIEKHDLSSLTWCASGGAPLPLEVQRRFQEISGCRLAEGWGMTETSPSGTFTPVQGPEKPGSCGIPMPGMTVKFADVDDVSRYVAFGKRGEICVSGPNVMRGYWKNPEATNEVMTADGFLRTGDVGYIDGDGYVHIVDRIKDMLLCGGFNVYPRTIEEAIYQHPSVAEVCVIGIQDEYRGQSPKAFIKLKNHAAAVAFDELKEFLRDKLGKHEMITDMEIRADLPKTPVGKLSKKELLEEEAAKRKHTP